MQYTERFKAEMVRKMMGPQPLGYMRSSPKAGVQRLLEKYVALPSRKGHCRKGSSHLLCADRLYAVAVAPGLIPLSSWIPTILSDTAHAERDQVEEAVGLPGGPSKSATWVSRGGPK